MPHGKIKNNPTASPSKKLSWFSIFYQVKIPEKNRHKSLLQFPMCCKAWSRLEHQVIFLLKNQVGYLPFPLLKFQAINLPILLVVAQLISLVAVHKLIWVCTPLLFQVLNQPHFLQMFQEINPVTIQAFIHYRLQLGCQVLFHLLNIVTSQPMLQVYTKSVDQLMILPIF